MPPLGFEHEKVLIIEDDQIVAHIYRNKFLVEGFQVEVAHTGEAGLQLIHNFQPDAVLLDLVLPKMSGVDVMKEVRAESQFKALPLVVFSNTASRTWCRTPGRPGPPNVSPRRVARPGR